MENGYDACIEMDADLSHDPADIPHLIEKLNEGYDLAIGSRYLGGVRVMDWPEYRLLLSTGASRYVRILTGMPLTDATSGFKAIRSTALRLLDWKRFKAEGYGFQVELHYFLWKAGCAVKEVPIVFTERRKGRTKMTPGIAWEAAVRVAQLAFQRIQQ
jgi:dolichol-phosphate mannosyltransferase